MNRRTLFKLAIGGVAYVATPEPVRRFFILGQPELKFVVRDYGHIVICTYDEAAVLAWQRNHKASLSPVESLWGVSEPSWAARALS